MTREQVQDAIVQLEAEGKTVSANAIVELIGGSKRDVHAHLQEIRHSAGVGTALEDPDDEKEHQEQTQLEAAPAQSPEQAFRETWQQYLTAGMHALVVLGIPGQPGDYTRGRPSTTAQNALPADHPWRQQILDEWHTSWCAHMDALARLRQKPTDAERIAQLETELAALKQEAQANSEQQRHAGMQVRDYEAGERVQRLGPQHPANLPYRQQQEIFRNAYARSIELSNKIKSVSLQLEQRRLALQAGRLYYE